MPVCPQCDNRSFSNKEALLQHMKSSSAWHPFCSVCDRRFVSETAYDAHMAAKHPPTYDCITCNKSFHAPFALEDHYRGSQNHPNCVRCGRGFHDDIAREEHLRTAHPKSPCGPCGGMVIYDDALDQHYTDSQNHPSCFRCGKGFKDDVAYSEHISSIHPELHCKPCRASFETPEAAQMHFWTSPLHSKCDRCNMGFENEESRTSHEEMVHAPTPTVVAVEPATVLSPVPSLATAEIQPLPLPPTPLYSTGFTPLSPKNHAQRLIVGERRVDTPELQLQLNFASPLQEVKPVFSPTSLPRPGGIIEELWSSRENVQIPAAKAQHKSPEMSSLAATFVPGSRSPMWSTTTASSSRSPPSGIPVHINRSPPVVSSNRPSFFGDSGTSPYSHPQAFSPPRSFYEAPPRAYQSHSYPTGSSTSSIETSRFTLRARENRRASPPQMSPPRTDFNSRLYPGSVRHAARTASLNRPSPPTESAFTRSSTNGSGYFGGSDYGSGSSRYHQQFSYDANSAASDSTFGRSGTYASSDLASWNELTAETDSNPELGSAGSRATLFSETLTTPRAESPGHSNNDNFGRQHAFELRHSLGSHGQILPTSPSLATVSSPASSALGHSPGSMLQEPDTRPTTASSTRTPSFNELAYTITPSSECGSPRSPEVTSPIGLSVLPPISPLAATPIDISSFDIPEARKPLPASPPPEAASPVTVILDIVDINAQQLEVPVPSVSPISVSSSQSYITSPQEPPEDEISLMGLQLESKSIQTTTISSPPPTPTVTIAHSTNPNPLHCRVCLADSCDDITASMCGHIFCNRCITDAVIKTNRCPVCMTPTLLYCLFRLDLAA